MDSISSVPSLPLTFLMLNAVSVSNCLALQVLRVLDHFFAFGEFHVSLLPIAPVSFVLAAAAHLADKIRGADPSHLHLEFCRQDEGGSGPHREFRSEEHTSELQSHSDLVCRLLLEKKKNKKI